MWIDFKSKCLACDAVYLASADKRYLYLDVIHELVHVKQMKEGRELFDERYRYLERPTEIAAYGVSIAEAKRIGMSGRELTDYLRVEWVTKREFARFIKKMGLS